MYEKYSVLFVDDEINILNSLQRGLMDEEYKCYFATSGKEALKILEKTKISVIVSDMRMPEMDGLKLLREVEDKYPHMIKIVLSGYTQLPQILVTINQVDIFKFITKPWKLEGEFKVVIHKALDYYILHEENEEIKKALRNKNQAYTNILKNIDETVASAKRSSDILSEFCKQIISFNCQASSKSKEVYTSILDLQSKIFDLIAQAIKGDEKEASCEALFNEVVQVIETYLPVSNKEIKPAYLQKVKLYYKIAVAIMISCTLILEELYKENGLYLVAAVNNTNVPTISLICPKVYTSQMEDDENVKARLEIKLDFLNSVISNLVKKNNMDFYVTQLSGNMIAVLTLNSPQNIIVEETISEKN